MPALPSFLHNRSEENRDMSEMEDLHEPVTMESHGTDIAENSKVHSDKCCDVRTSTVGEILTGQTIGELGFYSQRRTALQTVTTSRHIHDQCAKCHMPCFNGPLVITITKITECVPLVYKCHSPFYKDIITFIKVL
jgi:hypothetical protein